MKKFCWDEKAKTKLYKTKHGWIQCLIKYFSSLKIFSVRPGSIEKANPDALDDEIYEEDDTLPAFMMGMNAMVTVLGATAAGIAAETVIGPKVKADTIHENASVTQSQSVSQSATTNNVNSQLITQSEKLTSTNISSPSTTFSINSIVRPEETVITNKVNNIAVNMLENLIQDNPNSTSQSEKDSKSLSESNSMSISEFNSMSLSESISHSMSESLSQSQSMSEPSSQSISQSMSKPSSQSISRSTSKPLSQSTSRSIKVSTSASTSAATSQSTSAALPKTGNSIGLVPLFLGSLLAIFGLKFLDLRKYK